ncbi:MAG: hypothetical protein KIB43_12710 [Clostridium baratii]|uniref:glycan biosynthesis hexose transferase WsfD n=1 Tax=Clostridium baratii TaxID=1561 RepID=UPI00242A6847|nr:hypothetical protein [Clostridium baratii]MBS6007804.1 hypothetical protein [Clostridium baratii]
MQTKIRNYFKGLEKRDYIAIGFTSALLLYLIYVLLVGPIFGKADNGDFGRLYRFIGLSDFGSTYEEIYDGFLHQTYNSNPMMVLTLWAPEWVSGGWFLKISYILNLFLNPANYSVIYCIKAITLVVLFILGLKFIKKKFKKKSLVYILYVILSSIVSVYILTGFSKNILFDVRFVSILYIAIFTLGFYWIMTYNKFNSFTRVLIGIFVLLFFTDQCYIGYFNSFFGEGTMISFTFLTIGAFLRLIQKESPREREFIIFLISSFGLITSKTQMLPLLLLLILVYIALYVYYKGFRKLVMTLSICIVAIGIIQYFSIGDHTNKNNIYQAVFTGVTKDSPNPEEDLIELGVNPKFAANAGSAFYDPDLKYEPLGDEMLNEFYPNVSFTKVLKFYLKHYDRAYEKFKVSAENAYRFYDVSQTDFVKGSKWEDKKINSLRTDLISKYPEVHKNFYIFFMFSLIYLITLGYYFFKSKKRETKLLTVFLLYILASGASQLVLPVIGSGEADFGKHLFGLNLYYDVLIGTAIAFIGCKISQLFKYKK